MSLAICILVDTLMISAMLWHAIESRSLMLLLVSVLFSSVILYNTYTIFANYVKV